MASPSRGLQTALQLILIVVIAALMYWLYVSLTGPYEEIRRQEEITAETRARMSDLRIVLIRFEAVNNRFTASLDSLVMFAKSDSLLVSGRDSLFGPGFAPDSLPFSPRTGNRFVLTINDTTRVQTYLLQDPDTRDHIGTALPDVTLLNASSWE
jgi:hypothetical protein